MNIFVMISLIVAAFVTATISGFLGMGGGIILLGVMSILLVPSVVVPIHGVVQLSSNTTRTVLFLKHVRWSVFLIYVGPATLGCIGRGRSDLVLPGCAVLEGLTTLWSVPQLSVADRGLREGMLLRMMQGKMPGRRRRPRARNRKSTATKGSD